MTLPLTFGRTVRDDGVDVQLACASGQRLRYEVRPTLTRGHWLAVIMVPAAKQWRVVRSADLSTRRAARQYCARDFWRRQLIREVA